MSCHYKFVNVLKNIMVSIFPNALYLGYGQQLKKYGMKQLERTPDPEPSTMHEEEPVVVTTGSILKQRFLSNTSSFEIG